MTMRRSIVLLAFLLHTAVYGQVLHPEIPGLNLNEPKPEVLILGVYHMANNNLDAVKTNWDSPLTPKRQREIQEVVDRLKEFKPTKIAVEAVWGNSKINERYSSYRAGKDTLLGNETDQIGLRLAQQLGHQRLYPIDYKKDMDFDRVMQFAMANGQQGHVERMQQIMGFISAEDEKFKGVTVREHLLALNDIPTLEMMNGPYLLMAEVGKDSAYVGADVVAGWYERNLKIAMNIIRIAESPSDRILVLIGAGHATLLRQFLSASPSIKVVTTNDYLK